MSPARLAVVLSMSGALGSWERTGGPFTMSVSGVGLALGERNDRAIRERPERRQLDAANIGYIGPVKIGARHRELGNVETVLRLEAVLVLADSERLAGSSRVIEHAPGVVDRLGRV